MRTDPQALEGLVRRPGFHALLQVLLAAAGGVLLLAVSERIYVNNGLGWDGGIYAHLTLRFDEFLATGKAPYAVSYFRYLPSALVFLALKACGAQMTIPNVITGFQVVNIALYALMALAWNATADALRLRLQGRWLGWMFLFLNYAVLKFSFFYPTLTDTHALAFATFMLWAHVVGRRWTLAGLTAAGLYVWPVLPLVGACLLLFPRKDVSGGRGRPWLAAGLALAFCAVVLVNARVILSEGLEPVFYSVRPLSIGLLFLYLFALAHLLLRGPGMLDPAVSRRQMLLAGALTMATAVGLAAVFFLNADLFWVVSCYVRDAVLHGSRRPLEFLVAHTLYLGPAWLLAVCFADRLPGAAARLGWGLALAVLLMGLQAINPLTRQCIIILPFLGLLTAMAMEEARLGAGALTGLALLSLLLSKVWYSIGQGVDTSISGDVNPVFWPRYVNSTGYYMLTADYAAQGAFLLFVLAFLFLWLRRAPRAMDA